MKNKFLPKSRSGKWAVGLGLALVILTALSLLFASLIGGDAEVVAASPWLSAPAAALSIAFTLAGPLSFFTGIYTVIKYKDRSVYLPLAVSYGLTLTMFLMGEFLFPH
jgi:hypothetical protein